MASKLDIWNAAISEVGGAQIAAVDTSDSSAEARQCRIHYDRCKASLLRSHPWNFALTPALLSPLSGQTPKFGYTKIFQVPGNSLRIIRPIYSGTARLESYKLYGKTIYASVTSIGLVYVRNISEAEILDPLFEQALSSLLAWKIGPKLTDKPRVVENAFNSYRHFNSKAKAADALEDNPTSVVANELLLAFMGSGERSLAAEQGIGEI